MQSRCSLTLAEVKLQRKLTAGLLVESSNRYPLRSWNRNQQSLLGPPKEEALKSKSTSTSPPQLSPHTHTSNLVASKALCVSVPADLHKAKSSQSQRISNTSYGSGGHKQRHKRISNLHNQGWTVAPEGWEIDMASDALRFARERQKAFLVRETYDIPLSKDITPDVRAILCDWLIQIQHHLRLLSSTLYLAIQYTDRYVAKVYVSTDDYQLVGITALLIAIKMEERLIPELEELVELTENSFEVFEMKDMEKRMLQALNYELATPHADFFLRLAVDAFPYRLPPTSSAHMAPSASRIGSPSVGSAPVAIVVTPSPSSDGSSWMSCTSSSGSSSGYVSSGSSSKSSMNSEVSSLKSVLLKRSSYVTELMLVHPFFSRALPSLIAASTIALNLKILKQEYPAELVSLLGHTPCSPDMQATIRLMARYVLEAKHSKFQGAYNKYCSRSTYGAVAKDDWTSCEEIIKMAHLST